MAKSIQVAEHFPPGSKVSVIPRTTDFAPSGRGGAVKQATVDNRGEIKTDGLVEFGQYWLSDGERSIAINAPGSISAQEGTSAALAEEQEKRALASAEVRESAPALRAAPHTPDDMTSDGGIPEHNFEKGKEKLPAPAAKYVDVSGPQRVGADMGTAYPVDPAEIQPQPGKEHVKQGIPQRDGAEEGYATPVDPGEVQPSPKYEDEKGKQLVGADTGTAYPVPTGSKTEQEKAKSDSVSKAKGATVAKAGTDKVPARKAKGTPKASKAQAKKISDPVKPEAKRAVKKGDEA